MKHRILFLSLLLIGLASCDKIENPVNEIVPTGLEDLDFSLFPGNAEDYPVPVFTGEGTGVKRVLLEDYTGHKCNNCPPAAIIAEEAAAATNGRIVVVSIHASISGELQQVSSTHPLDFTTTAGNEYATDFNVNANPAGGIDRELDAFSGGNWFLAQFWNDALNAQLDSAHVLDLEMVTNHYPETDGLFVHVQATPTTELSGDLNLIVYLLRDEIISPQTMQNGSVNENYVHKHVLSDNINGTWGSPTGLDTVSAGNSTSLNFAYALTSPSADPTYAADNLSVVAFVVNRNTNEVLQTVYQHIE